MLTAISGLRPARRLPAEASHGQPATGETAYFFGGHVDFELA